MYCISCGSPLAAGLSYCNRCGTSLKERSESKTSGITAFLIAITLIAVVGMGIMLGGALTLKTDANLNEELVGFFMLFTFLTVLVIEVLLVKQLSKLTGTTEQKLVDARQKLASLNEPPAASLRTLVEPIGSVTENTTRTLEYSQREPARYGTITN